MNADVNEIDAGMTLADKLCGALRGPDGRIRAEDIITAAATIVGVQCIEAAGDKFFGVISIFSQCEAAVECSSYRVEHRIVSCDQRGSLEPVSRPLSFFT